MFVSGGSLVSTKTPFRLSELDSSFFSYMPGMSSSAWPASYGAIFERHLWVYVVVTKRGRALARLPLPIYGRREQGRERVDSHPMARLLSAPAPGLSPWSLWLWTTVTKDIYGQTFWGKVRTRGVVTGLRPLHPTGMRWDPEAGTWSFDNGKLRLSDIKPSDVLHFGGLSVTGGAAALSPLEPLRSTLENEWHARTATSNFWQRGARPGTVLMHERTLSDAGMRRLKAQWDEAAGGSGKVGGTVILEEGMEAKAITLTAEEAQYIETRRLNREEVCAAYDVPPPVVHILDRATFSNITEQMRSMYRDTMAPVCSELEGVIETQLRAVEWPNDDIYAEFLMDEVLRGDFETRQDALAKATHMTIAEKRRVENLPFIEGTDRIFLNTATLPLDAIDAQAAALTAVTATDEGEDADVIPLSVVRSLMGRLSWQRSLDDIDVKALTQGVECAGIVLHALALERAASGDVAGLRARIKALAKG